MPRPRTAQIELAITGLAHDGRGVARHAGKTVFVAGALPGETVQVRLMDSGPRFDVAELLQVSRPSPDRLDPPCPHYRRCGGCALQHLAPAAQLAGKQRRLEEAFARIGHVTPRRWLEPVVSSTGRYRARARLAVMAEAPGGGVGLGFRREGSRTVEPVSDCLVLEPRLAALLAPLRRALATLPPARLPEEAWLAAGDAGTGLGIVWRSAASDAERAALEPLREAGAVTLAHGLRRGRSIDWEPAGGLLSYAPEDGLALAFAPWEFTQANRPVNRALLALAMDLLEPRPPDAALDLFCGVGNFTLALARRVAAVTGVEGDPALVGRARANAAANGLSATRFDCADLARPDPAAAWAKGPCDIVLLDPPRAGAAALCPLIGRLAPRAVCYVSCDPATLARDAALLGRHGYALEAAGLLDMFPHTAHLESIALFLPGRKATRAARRGLC